MKCATGVIITDYKIMSMRFISTKKAFLSVMLFMGACQMASATTDPVVTKPIQGSQGQFVLNAESYARDMKYFSLTPAGRSAILNNSILNMVGVGIEEQSNYYIRSNFSVTVTLQITTYDNNESATGTFNKTFTVNYDTAAGAKYKSLDYTTYVNAFALRAKIISIDSGSVNWPVSKVLKVENQLTATRDYVFNCTLALDGLNTALSVANNELVASWTPPSLDNNAGVTEYDLEWAWVDEGAVESYKNGSNFVQDLVFTNNATRVSISGSSYNIPLLYDDTGKIFIRVRPVQLKTDGQRIEGKWSWVLNNANQPVETASPVFYSFNGHEDKLNWQASTSFAEEGKRKSVVQYFDGSLRNRQTVTKDNTSNTTVVAESFYNYQGQAVLQVLPAPTLNTAIQYVKNFNQAIGYNEYPKSVYDKLDAGTTVCSNPAKPFNTDFGTANYYSAKNPMLATDALAKYIPDATAGNPNEAYAFTETRLSPDGRVAAQGGVGKTHQLGSGHETKYYYESPAQEELDALFGTDAGVASHYFKNMVRDANGQFSVSYVDMRGRTVATALAGEAPKNADGTLMVDELDSKTQQTFTKQLIDKETNTVVGNSIISSKPIVVMKDNSTYAFDYSLTPKQLSLISCSTNQPICYDCMYQVKFTISSDCDNQLVYVDSMTNFTLGQYINQCNANGNAAQGFTKHFEKILNQGSYTVTKVLTLSSEAQAGYRDKFLQTDTCKKLVEFYNQELALLQATSNCAITCTSCKAALGNDLNGFIAKFATEMNVTVASLSPETIAQLTTSYNEAMANCDRICNNSDGLDVIRSTREMMLQDVTPPYGQYARNDAASLARAYNIFKPNDGSNTQSGYSITSLKPDYMQPRRFAADGITLLNSGNYFNEFNQQETVNPLLLTSAQFIDSFKTAWANQLLVHHPEFKKLQYSENQLKTAYQFEALLEKDSTWAQAVSHNYITNMVNLDPFFSGVGASYKTLMINGQFNDPRVPHPNPTNDDFKDKNPVVNGITNYVLPKTQGSPVCSSVSYGNSFVTMWQLALGGVYCRDKADNNPCVIDFSDLNTKAGCTKNPAYAQPANSFSEGCATDRDWAWKIYKSLYLTERKKLIAAYLNQNAPSFSAGFPNNGTPPYQQRFINYANPSSLFDNLAINGSGDVGAIITAAGDNLNAGNAQAQALAQAQYDTACRGYANMWIGQLRSCPQINNILNNTTTWVADSTWLITRLVAICKNGSDNNHYLGSSTVKPGNHAVVNGQSYDEFTQVVQEFMQMKGIVNPTSECYNWMINTPKPYAKQRALTNSYVLTKPTDCECQRITGLQTEWSLAVNGGTFTGTFSAWLQYQHGTYISNEQLDAMLALCNGSYQCKMLEKLIALPPALQCPSSSPNPAPKTCISCADYAAIKAEFNTLTSQQAPYVNPQNQTEVNYNYAFASYANNKTGFSKSWMEYVAFQNTCNASNPPISCGSLDSTLNAFYLTPEYITNPSGLPCVQAFLNYFNSHYNVVYTFNQWMALFTQCGSTPNICKPKITCSSFEALVEGFYNQNGVQIYNNSNCQYLFVSYVNTQLGSNYTFSQLAAIYNYTCGNTCALDVCSFPNHFLLTRVYNAFIAANPHPWNLPNCQQAFVDYFNTYFGLNQPLTWNQIQQYYPIIDRHCTPDLTTLCTPPYSCTDLNNLVNNFHLQPGTETTPLIPCETQFTTYFNQAMGTNYTFAQIEALYLSICGTPLTVCDVVTNCKKMVALWDGYLQGFIHPGYPTDYDCTTFDAGFVQLFNDSLETNYTSFAQLQALYKKCGYDLVSPCSGALTTTPAITPANLSSFLNSFIATYPDPVTQLGTECQAVFTANFNAHFGSLLAYSEIASYYLSQLQITLNVCNSQCNNINALIASYNTHYGSLKLPQGAKQDLFAFLYNQIFVANTGVKTVEDVFIGDEDGGIVPYYQNKVTDPKVFNPLVSIDAIKEVISTCGITGFNLNASGGLSLYDAQTLQSIKQVYYIIHPNGLPDACQEDFAGWFNRVMQVQYNYNDLLTLYNNVCGNNAGYICEAPPNQSTEVSVYVNFMGGNVATNQQPMLCGLNEPGGGPVPIENNPCKDLPKIAFHFAQEKYDLYVDSLRNVFDAAYREKCMAAKDLESFTVTYQQSEYHYTLYYYDQAGNLVKTIPPAGVNKLSGADLVTVKNYRANVLNGQPETSNQKVPAHTMATQYRYNTLNQVVAQTTPDAGLSKFYYDRLGRLVVSQNAKQVTANNYSYTLYDDLGRIKEVGQLNTATAITQIISQNGADVNTTGSLANWLNNKPAEQITRTFYDKSYIDGQGTLCPQYLCQTNLRNRVSYTAVYSTGVPGGTGEHTAATYYSYDIHGSVYELLQDYNSGAMKNTGNRFKKIAYSYDLISGKVNSVAYQPGAVDAFYHRYSYDAENRITLAETSTDKVVWEKDARYNYYKHGPLARTVLGELQVQGIDFAYTLSGAFKGINSTAVGDGTYDIGEDGKVGSSVNSQVARDVFGMSLNYFTDDYKSINTMSNNFAAIGASNYLFNGNIKSQVVDIPKLGDAIIYKYQYDQLNRLKNVDAYTGLNSTINVITPIVTNGYKEILTYDANGNIKTYLRNNDVGGTKNNYNYTYATGSNRLISINNSINNQTKIYDYDPIGNTVEDGMQGVMNAVWNLYGKLQSFTNAQGLSVTYIYNTDGQRICKKIGETEEWYVRDAGGNEMAMYIKDATINNGSLSLVKQAKYGNSYLGNRNELKNMQEQTIVAQNIRGATTYILVDHRGNNMVTINDKHIGKSSNNINIDYYTSDVITASYYSSYGALSKTYNESVIDKAYNGQKRSTELSEFAQTALYWEYNGDIGRRWNIDPKGNAYESGYCTFSNNPCIYSDILGDVVKYAKGENVTDREFRQFKRNIKLMRKNSESFGKMYKDLDDDKENIYTYTVKKDNSSEADIGKVENTGLNAMKQQTWSINVNIDKKGIESTKVGYINGVIGTIAHETGHAWRRLKGIEISYPKEPIGYIKLLGFLSSNTNSELAKYQMLGQYKSYSEEYVKTFETQERGANHLANIVLSELIKSGKVIYRGFDLLSIYPNSRGVTYSKYSVTSNSFLKITKEYQIPSADWLNKPLNTLESPHDKEYYLKTQFDISKIKFGEIY